MDKEAKPKRPGWKFGGALASLVSLAFLAGLFLFLLAFVGNTPAFRETYGDWGTWRLVEVIRAWLPHDERALFWKMVLSKAVCSSEIALVQMGLIFLVLFQGIRMLLSVLGNVGSGRPLEGIGRTGALMSMAMIMLPALGILSTVVGILSAGEVSRETAKAVIFGPSGLGILGYLMATGFHGIAEAVRES